LVGNPYDGHTLEKQLEQVERLVGAGCVKHVAVDRGYRGHKSQRPETITIDRDRRGQMKQSDWRWLKRRSAIEPIFGHLKSSYRLERNRLHGDLGNEHNFILSAAAFNLRKLLNFLFILFLDQLTEVFLMRFGRNRLTVT
jgi:IS5 family transposase